MRRLEDVSHFFLGRSEDCSRPLRPPAVQSQLTRPRITVLTSVADGIPGPLVVVGMAALLAQSGKKVVVAEGGPQAFGVTFAIGAHRSREPERSAIQSVVGVGVFSQPLTGTSLPRYYLDPTEYNSLREELQWCDLVCIHLGKLDVERVSAEILFPDEAILVVPADDPDTQLSAYQMIKYLTMWSPRVRIALIATGKSVDQRRLFRVQQATKRFLQRECLDLGWIPEGCSLAGSFLSGALLDSGWGEVERILGPLVDRWWTWGGEQPSLAVPRGNHSRDE